MCIRDSNEITELNGRLNSLEGQKNIPLSSSKAIPEVYEQAESNELPGNSDMLMKIYLVHRKAACHFGMNGLAGGHFQVPLIIWVKCSISPV